MAGLHLLTGNRMERLAEELADLLRTPWGSPLVPETVVVQSRGMERWLSQKIARRNGICANLTFPFPNRFLERLCEAAGVMGPAERSAFEPEALAFRLFSLFGDLSRGADDLPLRRYLESDPGDLRRWELAEQCADLFDQYLVFRPEMIVSWEETSPPPGEPHRWQALLWRRIVAQTGGRHREALRRKLFEAVRRRSIPLERLPARVFVFGISYLPPFHLEILSTIANLIDVYFFLLNPCREYWADLLSRREILRLEGKRRLLGDGDELHLEEGHPLLASLGLPGRQFLERIVETAADPREFYEDPGEDTLLHRIQSDLLYLRPPAPFTLPPGDSSIRVHSCHSPMREMEVLRDQLLDLWEKEPGLGPPDVVVMAPDISRYAPFASAVFEAGDPPIPINVADRPSSHGRPFLQSFFRLLDLKDSRFTIEDLLRILEDEEIAARFGLSGGEIARLASWLRGAGIRWGLDETTHPVLAHLERAPNTWKAGVERLLLGYALPAAGNECFAGRRGADLLEGKDAGRLGGFLDFLELCASWCLRLREPRGLSAWGKEIFELLEDFYGGGGAPSEERRRIERAIAEFAALEDQSGCHGRIPLEIPRRVLERRLAGEGPGKGFLQHGVTFCSMLPMRSIPFAVVCLVGLDHDAFPRETRRWAVGRMALSPRPGDRSRRSDDRYLFLEAILSARRRLIISYVGQDIQDNRILPPSVLVSELLDTLSRGYGIELEDPMAPVLVRHPLHSFSERYFTGTPALFSYSREDCAALQSSLEGPEGDGFTREPLPPESLENSGAAAPVPLEDLVAFLRNPARFYLRRLGVRMDRPQAAIEESEPFALEGLERYRLGNRILEERLAGSTALDLLEALRSEGKLPPGRAGEVEFRELWRTADLMARSLHARGLRPTAHRERKIFAAGNLRVSADLPDRGTEGVVRLRFARVSPAELLAVWIEHLAFCRCADPPAEENKSFLLGTDRLAFFERPSDPGVLLDRLVAVFLEGRRRPIPFFPATSYEFSRRRREGIPQRAALASARRIWEGDDHREGEFRDPAVKRCHAGGDPLGEEFQELSLRVWDPILSCLHEETLGEA